MAATAAEAGAKLLLLSPLLLLLFPLLLTEAHLEGLIGDEDEAGSKGSSQGEEVEDVALPVVVAIEDEGGASEGWSCSVVRMRSGFCLSLEVRESKKSSKFQLSASGLHFSR